MASQLRAGSSWFAALRVAALAALLPSVGHADVIATDKLALPSVAASAISVVRANEILDRWEPIAVAAGKRWPAWRETFATQLSLMDAPIVDDVAAIEPDAANAKASYAQFERALQQAQFQSYTLALRGKGHLKLGSPSSDQTFTPTVPCRIVDTRLAGGQISAGETRNYYFYGESPTFDFTPQGGSSSCTSLLFVGGGVAPSAAVVTVTVVSPSAAGNYVLWGGANPIPNVSALNWSGPGQIVANTSVIPAGGRSQTGPGGAIKDFAVKYNGPTGSAHFVADVVGYFEENRATTLDCYDGGRVSVSSLVGTGGTTTVTSLACSPGYGLTGGFCDTDDRYQQRLLIKTFAGTAGDARWQCTYANDDSVSHRIYASALCCRVPGR